MSETLIVALLAGGLFRTIQANGGIEWLTRKIALLVRGPRTCEFGVFLLVRRVAINSVIKQLSSGELKQEDLLG